MSTARTRLALVAVLVVVLLGAGIAVWSRQGSDPAPVAAAEPPPGSAPATTTTTAAPPTTPPPYRSVVATAAVPELEVLAERPVDVEASTTTVPTTAPAALAVAPIPRDGLASVGTRKTPTGWAFANPTSFGSPFVLAVTEIDGDWLRVEIPARPNSQEGWVRAADVTLSESEFRMELTLSDYTLRVFQGDEVVVETQVVIGRPGTPTPVGTFFLGEVLSAQQAGVGSPAGAYGPYILATSAYSETLDLFDGGLPVIAFHGTNQPGLIGTQSSNGCVRMPNDVVTQLAGMLPAGTVITVTA